MRSADKPASLGELMGAAKDGKLSLNDLPKILGEKMPKLTYDRIGRMRLLNSLQVRFGHGYNNLPGIDNIIKEFDKKIDVHNIIRMNRRGLHGG